MLLYNGRYNEKHDFVSLEIVEGRVVFSFSLGTVTTRVAASVPGGVHDGDWHTVTVDYNYRVSYKADDCNIHEKRYRDWSNRQSRILDVCSYIPWMLVLLIRKSVMLSFQTASAS